MDKAINRVERFMFDLCKNNIIWVGRFTKQVNWFGVHEVFDPSNRGRHLNPC